VFSVIRERGRCAYQKDSVALNCETNSPAHIILDMYSAGPNFDEMMLLETELPDELMSGGSSAWEQQMVANKPPAQGPGPGQQQIYSTQMNGSGGGGGGDDNNTIIPSNVALQQRQQHEQIDQLLLEADKRTSMARRMQLGNKTNLQAAPNASVMNNLGVSMPNANAMSMAPNNGTNNAMSMQGLCNIPNLLSRQSFGSRTY